MEEVSVKALATPTAGLSLLAALIFAMPVHAAAQSANDEIRSKDLTVFVEIDGSLPGFTQDQLFTYITEQMEAADVTAWKFAPAPTASGAGLPVNRIVWHFKPLPFAGGTIRYIGPALSKAREEFGVGRVISIDAKIYLDGKYQASTFDQITLKGGATDPALPGEIQKVTRTVVADALAEVLFGYETHAG
jgi:hypothetical protein